MKCKYLILAILSLLIFAGESISQSGGLNDRKAADRAMTDHLYRTGSKHETKRTIVWVEKDSLSGSEVKAFGSLVDQGITNIEKYTRIRFDKKHYGSRKVEYFISNKAGIPHVSLENKPFVYLTPERVKNKRTAYLHETTHIIVWKITSLWLQEGYASHVQSHVSKHYGGYLGFAFNPENKPIDDLARIILTQNISKIVLPLIGLNGTPATMQPEQARLYFPIFSDREVTAPAYYNLSESFVQFFVQKLGMKRMRKIFESSNPQTTILKLTGKPVDVWKTEWIKSLE
jgi:hypothetical protein